MKKKLELLRSFKVIFIAFFFLYFIIGILIFRDYGLSWDEPISRLNGIRAYEYVFEGSERIFDYRDRYYGTLFELPLYALEKLLAINNPLFIFQVRHLLTFILFYISLFAFYKSAKLLIRNRWLALLGVVMLALSPRIFADSFYNSKDLVFLSFFILAFYFITKLSVKKSIRYVLLLGIFIGLATDVRIIGMLLYPIASIFLIGFSKNKFTIPWRLLFFIAITSTISIYVFWPILWSNPIFHFVEAIKFMGQFSQLDDKVLYFGNFLHPREVPWHYLFVWIGITTPITYIILFVVGLVRFAFFPKKDITAIILWVFVPVIITLITIPALYDGWRQFYFIYPGIILIGLYGLELFFSKWAILRYFIIAVVGINIFFVVTFMVRSHPYQNVYFNELVGGIKGAEWKFDLDYWGLSFNDGLRYIAALDGRKKIPVYFAFGISAQVDFLEEKMRRFIPVQDAKRADYVLSNFRWQKNAPDLPSIFSVEIDGVKILGVYKLR